MPSLSFINIATAFIALVSLYSQVVASAGECLINTNIPIHKAFSGLKTAMVTFLQKLFYDKYW